MVVEHTPRGGTRGLRREVIGLAAVGVVALGLLYRLTLIIVASPPPNSDEATMGLAALHIAQGRQFPAYFYGQQYMGTLQAYLAAPLFAAFGPSDVALRLPMLGIYTAFCAVMWRLVAKLYDRRFALFTMGLLALGTLPVVRAQLFAGGGYGEIQPLGAALILLAVRLAARDGARWELAAFGMGVGLAFWIDWLIAPYVAAAVVVAVSRWRDLLGRAGLPLLAGALVGGLPAVVHLLMTEPGTSALSEITRLSADAGGSTLAERLYGGVLLGIPMATGMCAESACTGWPLALGAAVPMLLVIAGSTAVHEIRRHGDDDDRARHAGRLALAAGAGVTIILYARSDASGEHALTSVRYLSPVVISLPAVLWPLWASTVGSRAFLRVPGLVGLGLVTSSMMISTIAFATNLAPFRAERDDQRTLVDHLQRHGVTHFYTDYWTCHRLVFATGERLVCAVVNDALAPGHDRYPPYRNAVRRQPCSAYLLPQGSLADQALGRHPSFWADEIAGYRLYRRCAGENGVP